MWIVLLALRRPYTFIVLALLLAIIGPLMIRRTPTDIFPNINIPVLSIVWTYNGFSADDMANRITTPFERALTSDVDNIEHIESQTVNGTAVIKVYFHQGADINRAVAEAVSSAQSIIRVLPPGTLPPLVIAYNASTVPILQLALSSHTLSEQQLYDLGNNFIRTQLATVQGAAVPLPFGGKVRQIMVDINTQAMQARDLSPLDVVNAVNAQNLILPGGTAKIGALEYNVNMNASPGTVAELNQMPVKATPGGVIYLHDVATVRDGFAPQTNIVRVNGTRSALLQVEKSGDASTLDIIRNVKDLLPQIAAGLPKALQIKPVSDQSIFVSAAVDGVVREGLIAAGLTAVMILLFLGSWRSTLIIAITIPLSVVTSLIVLSALGQTINIMTLGGLALAVGILVDDATVAIEAITHHRESGKPLMQAIIDASAQIALPTLVSTLSICIVFLPMFLLSGVARYLFVPLAEAVVFAMLASYFFSRTLIPTLAMYMLKHESLQKEGRAGRFQALSRLQQRFEHGFESIHGKYQRALQFAMAHPKRVVLTFLLVCGGSLLLIPFLGRDFFPTSDTGEIRLHMRARTGTRIEQTARLVDLVEQRIRSVIPSSELDTVLDNIGLPVSGINMTYDSSLPVGSSDADILVSLKANHRPTDQYVTLLRDRLNREFPSITFSFLPADIISQTLDFGLPAPIDVQVVGKDSAGNREVADSLLRSFRTVPGLVDPRIQQPDDAPSINVDVDRVKAIEAGFQQRTIAQDLLIALSGSSQTSPNFWLNPKNGVSYPLMTEAPQYTIDSLQALRNIPLSTPVGARPQGLPPILGSLSTLSRTAQDAVVSHYNVQPVIDVFAGVQGRDLGSVASDVDCLVKQARTHLPAGSSIVVRGVVQTMQSSFEGLLFGLLFAVMLVYALMVVNFQSWIDPLVIISGLPGALAGITWMLYVTHTTVSVPALTGAIMCVGIATANSILVVSFARERLAAGASPLEAALEAGGTRFRPVLMTALAMLIGMLPMSLGLGDGGEQNAPLGRAVIGGLMFGTVATLVFVPVAFAAVHQWLRARQGNPGGVPALPAPHPSV
ncbi:efflux RND transporter permease subunit [Dyella flava]|uniref:Efflux RND transporter permease subunit n=1 Tax=Dyella flava TaxID=1920170 RepID=A0ABS2K216_9GAMM|nr:efflux RND transporter permease subunit [Dyella flava]MBM7125287.1 efflux RND transporter permease subunit [Dyella flava]GLQ50666.1 RND transporter [Dyella flava]